MSTEFADKVVLITGGNSGIGLATAKAFAEAGASVAIAGRNEKSVRAAAKSLTDAGHSSLPVICDVADEVQVEAMVAQTIDAFGRLDFAFNNAGIQSPIADTAEADGEEFDRVIAINLRGVWSAMKYELQQMLKQGTGGAIVNTSSLGGLVGIAGRSAYHASKHGVLGMTKSTALEYAARGIRVNAVCPGIIDTPMVDGMKEREAAEMDDLMREVPIGRLGRPEELASAVLFLCSPGASYVIGHALVVDGGYTIH